MESIRQLTFILVVLSALAGLIALLKKRSPSLKWPALKRTPRRLEVLERVVLSQHASLLLVRLDQREILITTSGEGCNVLEERKMASGAAA